MFFVVYSQTYRVFSQNLRREFNIEPDFFPATIGDLKAKILESDEILSSKADTFDDVATLYLNAKKLNQSENVEELWKFPFQKIFTVEKLQRPSVHVHVCCNWNCGTPRKCSFVQISILQASSSSDDSSHSSDAASKVCIKKGKAKKVGRP